MYIHSENVALAFLYTFIGVCSTEQYTQYGNKWLTNTRTTHGLFNVRYEAVQYCMAISPLRDNSNQYTKFQLY